MLAKLSEKIKHTLGPIATRSYIFPMTKLCFIGRRKRWEGNLGGRMGRGSIERMVNSIMVIIFVVIFIFEAVLMMDLRGAPVLPSWNKGRYLLLYHISNLQRFPVIDLQFFHHLQGNINCSVIHYVKGKIDVPSMTCNKGNH